MFQTLSLKPLLLGVLPSFVIWTFVIEAVVNSIHHG